MYLYLISVVTYTHSFIHYNGEREKETRLTWKDPDIHSDSALLQSSHLLPTLL